MAKTEKNNQIACNFNADLFIGENRSNVVYFEYDLKLVTFLKNSSSPIAIAKDGLFVFANVSNIFNSRPSRTRLLNRCERFLVKTK